MLDNYLLSLLDLYIIELEQGQHRGIFEQLLSLALVQCIVDSLQGCFGFLFGLAYTAGQFRSSH